MASSPLPPLAPLLPFSTSSDDEVLHFLKEHRIGLSVPEARKISEMLKRDPTVVEATVWGIQGSEHCSYKSSRRFLKGLPVTGKHVILGPGEDSGIVAITDGPKGKRWGLVVSHESHNHPSQIVPFEGAATGIGGVVRDVVCMGARVIGAMDNLRLGDLRSEESRTIAREVARGIAGYGNPLGIPNLGGDTVFDASYNTNCLVNAVALGIVREDEVIHSLVPEEAGRIGYDIILVGKPTDRSGFGGASFASILMEEEKKEQNSGAVQEPNPFLERHLLASTYALFDWLAEQGELGSVSFKDLGAGGVVCASVEQVAERGLGANVDLGKVHVSVRDLPPEVIACAETQERFCWIVHPRLTEHVLKHYNEDWDLPAIAEHARASVIGKVTTSDMFHLHFGDQLVCSARALDITCGLQYTRPIAPVKRGNPEPEIQNDGKKISVSAQEQSFETTIENIFRTLLRHPNGASTWPVIRHYDKNIIGNTIVEAGEADAAVIAPLRDLESYVQAGTHPGWDIAPSDAGRGVVVASDGKGRFGRIAPYLQGLNAAAESMRNIAATGAQPRALTDCLNYGNPEIPEQLFELSEGVRGIADASKGVVIHGENVPVISGNVSLYNGRLDGSAIDPTAIVCCIGVLPDARQAITMSFKSPGSLLFLLGGRKDECGGSLYYEVLEETGNFARDALLGSRVPVPDLPLLSKQIEFLMALREKKLITSCHDISDGGLLMALFEMTLPQRKTGGGVGCRVDLTDAADSLRTDAALFSETGGFILEADPNQAKTIIRIAEERGCPLTELGRTTREPVLEISRNGTTLISEELPHFHEIWQNALTLRLCENGGN
ncbi:MAG: phosphoribosylformylglycinamidine synthase subunit PurL [Candidatus Peregrinibacteria bacterium]